jgi:hypothetical protein
MLPDEKITLRTRLGFIGLGHLGSRIARRLVAPGSPWSSTISITGIRWNLLTRVPKSRGVPKNWQRSRCGLVVPSR